MYAQIMVKMGHVHPGAITMPIKLEDPEGEKAANIPVQPSAKATLILNLKTAKELGNTVPTTVLGRADEVIDEGQPLPLVALVGPAAHQA
jgi:hypothetical protein